MNERKIVIKITDNNVLCESGNENEKMHGDDIFIACSALLDASSELLKDHIKDMGLSSEFEDPIRGALLEELGNRISGGTLGGYKMIIKLIDPIRKALQTAGGITLCQDGPIKIETVEKCPQS